MDDRYGQNNVRRPGRPVADMIELIVVCFNKVSGNRIPKDGSPSCNKLKKKTIVIRETDNISEKFCNEFNLNQGLKLYNVKSGRPIEVEGEINFESVKSYKTKKHRNLYIGPDTHDIRDIVSSNNNLDDETFTNEVSNQSSDHVNGSPVSNSTMINRSHTHPGSPLEPSYNSPNPTNNINAGTSINGNFNNHSSRGHTNELSDHLILKGINYSLVQIDYSQVNNLPDYAGTLLVKDVLYSVLPTNGFIPFTSRGHTNELSGRLIVGGDSYSLVQVVVVNVNDLPVYSGILKIGDSLYLALPKTIPIAFTNGGANNQSSNHINTNTPNLSFEDRNSNNLFSGIPVNEYDISAMINWQ
ncbi:hypothetical protein C1646_814853 [Rhizophagus diaphanus]|nr:hypothetical protein C1646_814853 [Rhizophagus diaphanus] [Rhizophagus sp. MUCL 43196]